MTAVEILRTLFEYHHALYSRLWQSIEQLTNEQFLVGVNYSHGSIRDQMMHVAVVQARWLRGLKGQPGARTFNLEPADYPNRADVRALWQGIAAEVDEYVASLSDEDLERTPPGMYGPTWQVLAHLVNHGTDHRAQILRILHDLGAPTFDQDLILHLWMR